MTYEATESRNGGEFVRDITAKQAEGFHVHSWNVNPVTGLIVTLYVRDTKSITN
jgi:hypothetical protein